MTGASSSPRTHLSRALRLIVITDAALAGARGVDAVVSRALAGGARAIQLRDKRATAAELLEQTHRLLRRTRPAGALLFVNDRLDVALAAGADGAHLGPTDIEPATARRIAPAPFLLGYSTDDPEAARRAEAEGVDYLGCGAVFGTTTKDVGGEAIGPARLHRVASAVRIPVVGIGGITADNVGQVAGTAAAGCAVISEVMGAPDPAAASAALLAPFRTRS